jgi:hypothetical protein
MIFAPHSSLFALHSQQVISTFFTSDDWLRVECQARCCLRRTVTRCDVMNNNHQIIFTSPSPLTQSSSQQSAFAIPQPPLPSPDFCCHTMSTSTTPTPLEGRKRKKLDEFSMTKAAIYTRNAVRELSPETKAKRNKTQRDNNAAKREMMAALRKFARIP